MILMFASLFSMHSKFMSAGCRQTMKINSSNWHEQTKLALHRPNVTNSKHYFTILCIQSYSDYDYDCDSHMCICTIYVIHSHHRPSNQMFFLFSNRIWSGRAIFREEKKAIFEAHCEHNRTKKIDNQKFFIKFWIQQTTKLPLLEQHE